ncbi:uncharacterized protein BXZ73DRAFT_53318 [Epithele typhae]|uniref:uncharacterized protein n=1 Tax=Epithele typhae TaxID=378194 RepID=UPI002007308C|nr:uncharacterized protein BXZ73DRAFT_53318 [Epithele typhae]KAH9917659.1 hypothetical protein BXZ73DRAFT_53318 [Epithele typhae]
MADYDSQGNMRLQLQALLDDKEKQLQSAATLGHQLLAQRMELEERIKQMQELELDSSGSDDGLDASVRDRYRELADAIKAWDMENEHLTSVFGSKPTNGIHAPPSRHTEPSRTDERSKGAAAGQAAAQSSRRAKNAAHRADDVEFAFEIGSGLLTEVRRLQSLLAERDKAIQDMKEEKDDLEKSLESLRQALREQEQSADKFKEENWNLEVTLQELRSQVGESQANALRLEGENKRLTRMLATTRETADQHKTEAEKQQTAFVELKAKHETDVAQARKHAASLQRDKSDLQQTIDNLKVEMQKASRRLPRFGSPLTPNGVTVSEMATPADRDDDDVFSTAGASTHTRKKLDNSGLFPPDDFADESPDPSPSKPFLAPNHPTNEIEALQQRLAHAQRQISTLKSTLQREKELRMDYRRKLDASPGFSIEEEEDDEVEEETDAKPKARLTPYRSSRGRGRGRGRGGLTLIQRLGMAAHSPSSDYNDDMDFEDSPVPSVPPIPAEFRQDEEDDEPEPPASPSPVAPSNRTSVDGMDPAFANVLRRSASASSVANGSPLRQSVLARTQRGGTLPRRSRGGAAYQEARPPSLVGQPEALAAELGFGPMEPEPSTIADDLQEELAAVETVDFGVQTDFEEPVPPPVIQVTAPSMSDIAIQADPEPLPVTPTSEMSAQTDAEVVPTRMEMEVQAEPSSSVAEVQTAAPSVAHMEMQTSPKLSRVAPIVADMGIHAAAMSRSSSHESEETTMQLRRPPSLTFSDLDHLEDEDDMTETGSIMGETTDFTDAYSVPMTPVTPDTASDYHSIMTVSDAEFSDGSISDDESIRASQILGSASAMSSQASFPSPIEAVPEVPAKPEVVYESKEIETDPIPEPPKPAPTPVLVPEPEPEPKPEMKEMSIQTDEWVPPAPPASAIFPVPIPSSLPTAAVSVASALPAAAATTTAAAVAATAAGASAIAAAVPSVFRVGPSSQQFQFIAPPAPATPVAADKEKAVAPSPNTTIRDANATFIARPRTSHSDRRQSIESTLSSVLDDVATRSRTPSMLPNLVDKSRPPMMVLPPPPRAPPPPNSMLPPAFIPDKRMSHDMPPPRPSSPPPPELIHRATTPSLGIPGRGTIGRAHGSSMPPSQQGLRQLPSTSSFRSAANAAARAGQLSSPSAISFGLQGRERRELSNTSLNSGGHSIGSQRSSISSENHAYETHMRRRSAADGLTVANRAGEASGAEAPGSTDPMVIHAITQTMIGEFLYKYTRRAIGKGHGERRHKRFFWVHPYTRTLYWSSADPGSSNVTESSAKSAYIESVRAVMDPNPMPPGIYQYSVIVSTPQREMKFTAPTKERHDIWFNALKYLLSRPGQAHLAAGNAPANSAPMSPMSANGDLPEEYNANLMSSPESQRSTRTNRNSRPGLNGDTWNTTPRGQRSRSQISLGGSMGKRSGTPAAEYLRWAEAPSSPSKEYEHVPGGPDDDDADFELHDDTLDEGFEGLENVRACCDGRHTVGRSGRIHDHHHHHHTHPPSQQSQQSQHQKREPSRARGEHLDPSPMELQRPVSPAWSFRSRAGSSTSHDGAGFFSRFGTRRSTRTVTDSLNGNGS